MSTSTTGTIVQTIGAVIDIEFPRDAMPSIYDALVLEDSGNALVEKGLTFEVEQQLGDGVVRTIALGSADGLQRGMRVKTSASERTTVVSRRAMRSIIKPMRVPAWLFWK